MTLNSGRKSGSSGRSTGRKRVVIGAEETTRVRYSQDRPQVESERRRTPRQPQRATKPRPVKSGPKPTGVGRRIAGAKRDEREQRQKAMARRRTGIGVAAAVVVFLVLWGLVALWRAPILPISKVDVVGNSHLTTAQVTKLAAVPRDATLMRFDAKAAEERIKRNPWIESVTISRKFPNAAVVTVVERRAAAVIDAGGTSLWLVDPDGTWLGRPSSQDATGLVTVRDIEGLKPKAGERGNSPEVKNALAVIAGISPEMKAMLKTISAPTVDKTALITKSDIQIMVGSAEDIAKKDRVALKILGAEKGVVYVNVRVVDRATWRGLNDTN
jgi:cell division protein FtsQ